MQRAMRWFGAYLAVVWLLVPHGSRAAGPLPEAWVTPLALDFGPVGVGSTSAPQVVTITNTGNATLTEFAGGAPFDPQFGATQNCAGGVAPGASCQYTFTFAPTATGVFSSTSNSSTNAGPFSISLRGEGMPPKLSVSPQELDFGDVTLGATSAPQVVTIRNVGLATLTEFAGGAPFDPQFGATQNCAGGVAPGASCQYTFTFAPTATGVFSSTSNSSTNAGPFSITLRGQSGNVPLEAQLAVAPVQVTPAGESQLTLKMTNRNRATMVDDVAVEIALPTGVDIGSVPNAALAHCGGGVLTAIAGEHRIRLVGARIGRGDACELHVSVVGKAIGAYTIRTSAISSSNSGTSDGVSATLRVAEQSFSSFLPLVRR